MKIDFIIDNGKEKEKLDSEKIDKLAKLYGLAVLIPNRYTSLFIVNLYVLNKVNGIDHEQIVEEIKCLEGKVPSQQTKPATEFKGNILKGLWHKHFFFAHPSVLAQNILNQLGKNGMEKLAEDVFNSSSKVVTQKMIKEFTNQLVEGSLMKRARNEKLTGEWIIFAIENGQNYYLCIEPHSSKDEIIANNIRACKVEFPFLSKYV